MLASVRRVLVSTHRQQEGQHMLLFALSMGLMVTLLAAVGNNDIVQVHYNVIDEAALLGAQAGASQVDLAAYQSGTIQLDAAAAVVQCRQVAHQNAKSVPFEPSYNPTDPEADSRNRISCVVANGYVEATVVDHGQYVIRTLGDVFKIKATHRAYPAYGVSTPCQPGSPSC
ncbi:MAG: hypothetical protein ACYDGR_07310 [Candidatus Dormibacteria bacterium]